MFDIACVGLLVADVIIKPVSSLPKKGLSKLVDSIQLFSGGNAMTAAINASRMGMKTALCGKIGNDFFGKFLKEILEVNDVDCSSLTVDQQTQTSASIVISDPDGERSFLHCMGSNGTFSINDINWDIIAQSDIIFFTGSFLMDSFDGEPNRIFLQKCKEMGKTTALDVSWDSNGRWSSLLLPVLKYVDFFLPSLDEAREIAGTSDLEEMAKKFIEAGVKIPVIKLGKEGCYFFENNSGTVVPPCTNIAAVVDTTGAGDSFCSGFLTAYVKGMSLLDCVRFANAAGALTVSVQGATTAIKNYDEVFKVMKLNY